MKILVVILSVALLTSCEKDEKEKADDTVRSVPVQTVVVETKTLTDAIVSTSTVDSRSSIDLVAEVPGVVTELNVEQGDVVKKKQRLAKLRREELNFGVQTAATSVKRLKEEVDRLKPLYDKGIVSKQVYNEALYRLESAQAEQRRARNAAGDAVVKATSNGVVAIRYVNLGQQVAMGTPMFRIVDPSDLLVYVNLPEQVLGQAIEKRTVIVESDALKDTSFKGVVEKVSPVVDPRTGTVRVTIALTETGTNTTKLRPGMFVRTRIVTEEKTDALAVPRRAVLYDENGTYVFTVADGSTAKRVSIKTGLVDGDDIQVTDGLAAGARVIVVGQEGLKDGALLSVEGDSAPKLGT